MKFAASIVTLLALSVAEAHNTRGEGERTDRENLGEKRSRTKVGRAKESRNDDGPSTIIGGTQSSQNDFPYYVDTANCGGSLIAPKVVLTAAHCGASYYPDKQVIVNGYERGEVGNGVWRTVSQVVPHPEYNENTLENDFELYLLSESVTGLSVKLSLNQQATYPADGTDLTVLGIGMQDKNGGLVNGEFLYDVVIPVVNTGECNAAWQGGLNPDIMICAGAIGKGACMGDSGGPLVVRNGNTHTQVGVVSFGSADCKKVKASENVFARTSGAINWIKSVVCDTWNEEADFCEGGSSSGGSGSGGTSGGGSGSTSGGGCTDVSGWTDSVGDGCAWYKEFKDLDVCEMYSDEVGTGGLSPADACCVSHKSVRGKEGYLEKEKLALTKVGRAKEQHSKSHVKHGPSTIVGGSATNVGEFPYNGDSGGPLVVLSGTLVHSRWCRRVFRLE
ncbi:unnamed protein product [Cylindrotheca closterium]|uniref:Peptidase S1 domain-containing protein n=1 Tax=Cylindrotheca closterium TaxID=2856 RepID=A0AAD2G9Z5_9STRA|nr:unnamed protein product [Cylindrotheca closterium]